MNSLIDDRDDDVRLPSRGAERHSGPRDETHADDEQDREFTLSTGTVLGLFFALALICAVFFGFGYTMGRRSGQATAEANVPAAATSSEVAAAKPSPSAPAIQAIPGYLSQSDADTANRNANAQTVRPSSAVTTIVVPTTTTAAATLKPVKPTVSAATVPVAAATPERKPVEIRPVAIPPAAPATVAPGAGTSYVQIAAVSHQEDADVLLSALKRRGYAVFTRPGDTDKLIHVQVGPFATKKDADVMRQRLLGDGYNAIVK